MTTRKTVTLGEAVAIERVFGGFRGGPGGGFGGTIDTTEFGGLRDSLALAEQWRFVQGESTTLDERQFRNYGTYSFVVYAIDENYADFLVSSNQDPQVLDEPRFNVTGGIGIFASMAPDSIRFEVK